MKEEEEISKKYYLSCTYTEARNFLQFTVEWKIISLTQQVVKLLQFDNFNLISQLLCIHHVTPTMGNKMNFVAIINTRKYLQSAFSVVLVNCLTTWRTANPPIFTSPSTNWVCRTYKNLSLCFFFNYDDLWGIFYSDLIYVVMTCWRHHIVPSKLKILSQLNGDRGIVVMM